MVGRSRGVTGPPRGPDRKGLVSVSEGSGFSPDVAERLEAEMQSSIEKRLMKRAKLLVPERDPDESKARGKIPEDETLERVRETMRADRDRLLKDRPPPPGRSPIIPSEMRLVPATETRMFASPYALDNT